MPVGEALDATPGRHVAQEFLAVAVVVRCAFVAATRRDVAMRCRRGALRVRATASAQASRCVAKWPRPRARPCDGAVLNAGVRDQVAGEPIAAIGAYEAADAAVDVDVTAMPIHGAVGVLSALQRLLGRSLDELGRHITTRPDDAAQRNEQARSGQPSPEPLAPSGLRIARAGARHRHGACPPAVAQRISVFNVSVPNPGPQLPTSRPSNSSTGRGPLMPRARLARSLSQSVSSRARPRCAK
jgi:hypothetical protein